MDEQAVAVGPYYEWPGPAQRPSQRPASADKPGGRAGAKRGEAGRGEVKKARRAEGSWTTAATDAPSGVDFILVISHFEEECRLFYV